MADKVARAEQAEFFQIKGHKEDRPPRLLLLQGEALGDLEEHGDAAGIVVRPRIELPVADAQVVEVGTEDNPLVRQCGVGSRQHGGDIAADETLVSVLVVADQPGDRLKIGGAERRRQLEPLEGCRQVPGCAGGTGPGAAHELGGGQAVDMRLEFVDADVHR